MSFFFSLFFLLLPRPPRSPLFPYTTLFRSLHDAKREVCARATCAAHVADSIEGISGGARSEEHTSELQSLRHLVCRLLLEKKKTQIKTCTISSKHMKNDYKNRSLQEQAAT